jgi:hypothetical protein
MGEFANLPPSFSAREGTPALFHSVTTPFCGALCLSLNIETVHPQRLGSGKCPGQSDHDHRPPRLVMFNFFHLLPFLFPVDNIDVSMISTS